MVLGQPTSPTGRAPTASARWRAILTGLLLGLIAVAAAPARPAQAHAALLSSEPARGAVVDTAPAAIVLTFTEPIRVVPERIRILDPTGGRSTAGKPHVDGAVLTIPFRPARPAAGTYLVSYRVLSADGHPVGGSLKFSIGAPSTLAATGSPDPTNTVDPVVAVAVPAAHYLTYAGLILLVGPILILARLWPRRLSRRGPARLAWLGLGLIAAGTAAALWLQVPYTAGTGVGDLDGESARQVLTSRVGEALLARLAVVAAFCALLRLSLPDTRSWRRATLTVLGVFGLLTWPMAGHPSASPVPLASTLASLAHLAAMATWMGGLVMLAGFLLRQADESELAVILPTWSRWAGLAVFALVAGGVVQALVEITPARALIDTEYGRLTLAKAAGLAVLLAVAGYARRLVHRGPNPAGARWLRRTVLVELALAAAVLAAGSALTQTPPARAVAAQAAAESSLATEEAAASTAQTLTSPLYLLQFDVFPAQIGDANTLHLSAFTPSGGKIRVLEWRVTAALPEAGLEPVEHAVLALDDSRAVGGLDFPVAGSWQLRFTLRLSDIDQATVTATVVVR